MEYCSGALEWSQGLFVPRNACHRDRLSVASVNTLILCGSLNCVESCENSFWLSLYSSNFLANRVFINFSVKDMLIHGGYNNNIMLEAGVLCVFVNSLVAN